VATVNGDVTIRAGSEDPITLQLLEDDGVTVIDLTGITALTLRLKDVNAETAKTFVDPKFTVSDATNGKVKLEQVAADFPSATKYEFYVSFKDSGGKTHVVPEDKNYVLKVIDKIE